MPELRPFPSLVALSGCVLRQERSPRQAVDEALERLERHAGPLGAVLSLDREGARTRADALAARLQEGQHLPLAGVPVALKDNLCTRGWRTTCGSRILEGFIPPYDATVVLRLLAAGAVPVAKTNMDEFGMGSSTENSAFFPTCNPWDPARTPGGSSGGSAVAVACGLVPAALGSDTGGSIRQPAAFTGCVGLRPTYGRVSRYGLVSYVSSMDQVGPLARSVEDAALLLQVLAGRDPLDATSSVEPVPDYLHEMRRDPAGLRVGLPREYYGEGVDPELSGTVRKAAESLAGCGAEIREVSLPLTRYAIPSYYLIATSEASSNLSRYDGVHATRRAPGARTLEEVYTRTRGTLFGDEVVRRIMLGTFSLSAGHYEAYYDRATRARTLLSREFEAVFQEVDVLVAPATPTPPFRLGERLDDPLSMYLADVLTAPASLAGLPGLVVPGGFVERGGSRLPVGIQILGPRFQEGRLLQVGRALEQLQDTPPLAAVAEDGP